MEKFFSTNLLENLSLKDLIQKIKDHIVRQNRSKKTNTLDELKKINFVEDLNFTDFKILKIGTGYQN